MDRVKVYITPEKISETGIGIYAKAFMDRIPHLPVIEDGRFHDLKLREDFIERIKPCPCKKDVTSQKVVVIPHTVDTLPH